MGTLEDIVSMNTRTRTIASFFSVAMAAMLLGAVVTTQMRPQAALARSPEPAATAAIPSRPLGPPTLDTFRDIAHGVTGGVVNINTKKLVKGQRGSFRDFFGDDMLDRFFGPQGPQGPQGRGPQRGPETEAQRSLGSGFVVDKDGYILTNRHVIEGADQISVTLSNGKTYEAKLVGKDARTDVALIKIEPKETLTILALGNSDQTDVAEWVMAIGNPFGLWQDGTVGGPSVTVGVVSFKGRGIPLTRGTAVEMIQTDAAINPGNSGGPLLNTRGEVIGINTMIITNGPQQSSGVGFAVPINVAKEILPQLRTKGRVIRGWLGVQIQPVTEALARTYKLKEAKGALIADVTDGSPADKAGLKPDDVVIGVDGREVRDNSDLTSYIASRAPETTVHLKVLRNGVEKDVAVSLGTFPEETSARDESSDREGRSHFGMSLQDLTPDMAAQLQLPRGFEGVVVTQVEGGSNAEDAGLQRGDVIVSVNGETVGDVGDVEKELAKAKQDGVARIRFRRGNQYTFTTLRLD